MSTDRAEVLNSHGQMVKRIRVEVREGDIVLLKASRKMEFDKIAEGLLEL